MENDQGVKKRIKELLKLRHITENQLSKLGRLSQKVLNNQLSHNANLQVETVLFIMQQIPEVSANWIMKGEGPMYVNECEDQEQEEQCIQSVPDYSSMVNSIIAAKDETIEALNGKIKAKDETIAALQGNLSSKDAVIDELKKKIASVYINDGNYKPFGVSEDTSTTLYKKKK